MDTSSVVIEISSKLYAKIIEIFEKKIPLNRFDHKTNKVYVIKPLFFI